MFMEVISIIISALALVVSVISFVKSNEAAKTANGLTQTANDLTQGQVEMQIRSMITSAKSHFAEMSNQLVANTGNETLQASVSAALEDVANAYDEACMKYLDGKVDNGQTIYQHIVCPFHYPPSNQQMAADFLCHIQHSRPNKIQPKMLSIVQICF